MNFINSNPEFKIIKNQEYEFYYSGVFDQSVDSIVNTLSSGKFPMNLKGNFAFFYKDTGRVVFAVDHLPTINLFYTENSVSHIFSDLQTPADTPNEEVIMQIRFFWGGSVGTNTSVEQIKRLEAGTYLEKNLISGETSISTYIDLFTHIVDNSITQEDISEIVETIIEEQTREPFNLLWSSGTDSNCILGFVRKLNRTDRCQLVSLYSGTTLYDERPQIEYLADVYKLTPHFHNLGSVSGNTTASLSRTKDPLESDDYKTNYKRTWNGWWHESTIFQKYESVYDAGFIKNKTLTGELGDQVFGSRFGIVLLKHLAQVPNSSIRDIATVFVSADQFRFHNMFTKEFKQWDDSLKSNPIRQAAWFNVIDWVEDVWGKINCGGDLINHIELLQYKYKGSHRCYNSSQFTNQPIINPFSDYRIFHNIFKTPGNWKISNGKTRRLSYNIIKDYVDPGPWNWKKSGVAIPTQQIIPKSQLEKMKSNDRT